LSTSLGCASLRAAKRRLLRTLVIDLPERSWL
jgi:hypothetical protein